MSQQTFWVRSRGRVTGPFTAEILRRMVSRGALSRVDEISRDQVVWDSAGDFVELFGDLTAAGAKPLAMTPAPAAVSARPTGEPADEVDPALSLAMESRPQAATGGPVRPILPTWFIAPVVVILVLGSLGFLVWAALRDPQAEEHKSGPATAPATVPATRAATEEVFENHAGLRLRLGPAQELIKVVTLTAREPGVFFALPPESGYDRLSAALNYL